MTLIDAIGWIAHLSLALCAAPQTIQAIKTKSSVGINPWFLILWLIGEVFALVYVLMKDSDMIQMTNYIVNLLFLLPIIFFKIKR